MIDVSAIKLSELPFVDLSDRSLLPATPCIYFALHGEVVQYVGKSVNPRQRWASHHRFDQLSETGGVKIAYLSCPIEVLSEVEQALIEWFDPPLNGLIERKPRSPFSGKRLACQLAALIDAHNLQVSESGKGDRLSQRSLAAKAEVAVTTINRLYNNTARRFDADVIEKICRVLNCEISDLFILREEDDSANSSSNKP